MNIAKKNFIDAKKFFSNNDIHKRNGLPWPRIDPSNITEKIKLPLQTEYYFQAMDYLDTPEALPIFQEQANIIIKNNYKKILDVGSRHGPINDILYDYNYLDKDYFYFGFDTSSEPIKFAKEVWKNFSNIKYQQDNWDSEFKYENFDCIIFSSVLLYRPDDHKKFFTKYMNRYNAISAIIQEPSYDQDTDKWIDNVFLNTIEKEIDLYKNEYNIVSTKHVCCDVFSGHRIIWHLKKK